MTTKNVLRDGKVPHWLEKAKPKYATSNDLWRVRIMRRGQSHNWWMKAGKLDPSSTGLILATAEWTEIKRRIVADESGLKQHLGVQRDGTFTVLSNDIFDDKGALNHGTYSETFDSKESYNRSLRRQIHRNEYLASPFADRISLDDYLDWLDFKETRSGQAPIHGTTGAVVLVSRAGKVLITDLLDAFEVSLKSLHESKASGLDDDQSIGKSRLEQYQYSIAHMKKTVGQIKCDPLDEFAISELQLETVLQTYRDQCVQEVSEYRKAGKRGRGKHWFNEKMKAARKLTTFLTSKRLCNGLPAAIKEVTRKSKVKAKAHPIPLPVLRAIWAEADDKFKTFVLLALNLGFRQTEISLLDWDEQHIVMEAGKMIVDKDRGKTGVPIKIPLWDISLEYITRHANESGKFFDFPGEVEKAAIECIGKRWNKIVRRAAKVQPESKKYHFENLRDTGASFLRTQNPFLVPLYLGQTTKGDAAMYISEVKDEDGKGVIPMFLDRALDKFLAYLKLH